MGRMTKQKKIEKILQDQVDIALEWYRLSEYIDIKEGGETQLVLFEEMMATILRTYTNIEEKLSVPKG